MARPRHPNKEIEDAIAHAESRGWTFVRMASHGWGVFYCPRHARDGCRFTVESTPRVPRNHADRFRKKVDSCTHQAGGN
jgi:hypothetical protein